MNFPARLGGCTAATTASPPSSLYFIVTQSRCTIRRVNERFDSLESWMKQIQNCDGSPMAVSPKAASPKAASYKKLKADGT